MVEVTGGVRRETAELLSFALPAILLGHPMFEQAFKRIDDTLRKDAGVSSELDYIEQTSWILFLKYLDALEDDRATQADLDGKKFTPLLERRFRWAEWAVPRTPGGPNGEAGKTDHARTLVGDDLRNFVDQELFPYLRNFKTRASDAQTLEYKVGEIFGELKNKLQSGYNLREILEEVDTLRFNSQVEKHELSDLYEARFATWATLAVMAASTTRPAMLAGVQPKIGETIYDGALGSAGFLCESFELLRKGKLTTSQATTLQKKTFYGQEKKPLAYVIGLMNMILHGIDAPNLIHVNTLETNLNDIDASKQVDIVLANPPFGGRERVEVQQNFPIKTSETAFLFLQHFIRKLKPGGRAGIVIKNTFLSNTDNASVSLRKKLLDECNLHTILDCPKGAFPGSGVQTVVLLFEKGKPTRRIWYYKLSPTRNIGKKLPLSDADLAEFLALQSTRENGPNSWSMDAEGVDKETYDLSPDNPANKKSPKHRSPEMIFEAMARVDDRISEATDVLRSSI